ncbi:MAG: NADH dehydrogenase (quinone) subunit G [Gammaproteobacteria bacterium]|nr:NADH dehydrogenase (quinone) subunit G [Gammaproteobacteria bacterium]|tara:strand:+ start:137828 stop:140137 length:2310 start_codon:yes stop_codon:yes gene_type:complete
MEIFINNKSYTAEDGETIIQIADKFDIHIPRFCYHKHLSIVANCRMCLVDIEGFKFAQPACSTLVQDGMKISTQSAKTKNAQKSTMEFLLINHPLDCPICDQGGECELQDVSLEYGDDHSNYMQFKRVVVDRDVSPLISTDMTRCIHCSRCVRFGEEVAATKELGLLDRGENMKIDSFIEKNIDSELSGNMIDLCPVGALNNKPYRYSARTWDLSQKKGISPHDCIGSNIFYHIYNNKIVRAVPAENENINQTWLSDRDRFGYEGIYAEDRCKRPMIKKNEKLLTCDWDTAIKTLNQNLNTLKNEKKLDSLGCLISPQSTCEELYLFQKVFREFGANNIDHRTIEKDFDYQQDYPVMPTLGCDIKDLEAYDNVILVGVNIKKEFPILSVRMIQAQNKKTQFFSINFQSSNEDFNPAISLALRNDQLREFLDYLSNKTNKPNYIEEKMFHYIFKYIKSNKKNLIVIGPSIGQLPNQTEILYSLNQYSKKINADFGYLTEHCNNTASWLLGVLPHRLPLGKRVDKEGLNAYQMIEKKLSNYIFYNLEPECDFWNNDLVEDALKTSKMNVFFSSFMTPFIAKYADIVLPISTFAETHGSFINIEGSYQAYKQIIRPKKEIKLGWEVLNNLLFINGANNYTFDTLQNEIKNNIQDFDVTTNNNFKLSNQPLKYIQKDIFKFTLRNTYNTDQIVRRSKSLQQTRTGKLKNILLSNDLFSSHKKGYLEFIDKDKNIKSELYNSDQSLPHNTIAYQSYKIGDAFVGARTGTVKIKS